MRKRREKFPLDNHERWLISYADFITLLFAFFVVMYAISSVNENKYRIVSDSIEMSLGKIPVGAEQSVAQAVKLPPAVRELIRAKEAQSDEQARMSGVASNILDVMSPLVSEGKVRVTQNRRGITIEINANVLFPPGRADLETGSIKVLGSVAEVLKNEPFNIEIAGHTDDVPISNSSFASNWELSAVRASRVVRLFAESGIQPGRLTAIGRESSQPIETNATPEGRSRNRRVELMILSSQPDPVTEIPVKAAGAKPQ
jgi:chemotaxis protein MotB